MELFFFILTNLFALLCFLFSRQNPNALANILLGFLLMGIGLNLAGDGLVLNNGGLSTVGSVTTFITTTYTTASNPWIFALFWMYLAMGFTVIGLTLDALVRGRVKDNGSIVR